MKIIVLMEGRRPVKAFSSVGGLVQFINTEFNPSQDKTITVEVSKTAVIVTKHRVRQFFRYGTLAKYEITELELEGYFR